MLQLQLLSLARTEEELVPVDVTVRAELVDLMARILVTVFQTQARRIDEGAVIQSQDQARTPGRKAIVYLRQSSEKQVRQNLEANGFSMSWLSGYVA